MLFMPRIVWGYWEAVQARNMSLGAKYVGCFERPYFEGLTKELNLEFDAVIHTSMEIKGICKRYRRAPYPVRRSIRLGFVCQIGLYLTAGLYALLAMPETRQPEKKTGGRWCPHTRFAGQKNNLYNGKG